MKRPMTRYVFERVERRATKRVKCAGGCGKLQPRARTFYQTINPFNKRADGLPKTRQDILAELEVEARNWQSDPERCNTCRRAATVPA